MNKIMKLIGAVALVATIGCRGMERPEAGLEVFGGPLIIENKSTDPLNFKWFVRGEGEWRGKGPLNPNTQQRLAPGSLVEYVELSGPRGTLRIDEKQLMVIRSFSGHEVILEIRPAEHGTYQAIPSRPTKLESTPTKEAGKASPAMALLNWFPRVKAKLFDFYRGREFELTSADLRKMEHLINDELSVGRISPRDFLDLPDRYNNQDVERAYDALEERLFNSREESAVLSAIERQLKYARDDALAQCR